MLRFIKNLYNWTLGLANNQYGMISLFILSLIESIFFPIPPDILLIALIISSRRKAFKFAIICSFGSLVGGIIGYNIGYYLWWNGFEYSQLALLFFEYVPNFNNEVFLTIKDKYEEYGFLIIFTAGFTPIPYKIFTISAGAFHVHFNTFIFASFVSRSARFFLIAILLRKYGETIKIYIDKYFNILTILVTMLIIIGYVIINMMIK